MTGIQKCLGFYLSLFASSVVLANPTGGVVVPGGSATITQSGSKETIHQNSNKVIINWQSFNIANGETTSFIQPPGGIALNRVTGSADPSSIFGALTATGKIILINQAGIYFGRSSRVNVGGIIASTSDIKNENFMAGHYKFDQPGRGSIINKGHINAADYGLIALIGTNISNEGVINARLGNVVLASGDKFTIDLTGDQLINFAIDAAAQNAATDQNGHKMHTAVTNRGTIIADGGTIRMMASVAQGVVDTAINMSGIAQAHSVHKKNGVILLSGGTEGNVDVSGTLDASTHLGTGGTIKVLGKRVHLKSGAKLDARGGLGGGEILVGGNFQGHGPEMNATETIVDRDTSIDVSASYLGSGGKAIVWSDDKTTLSGMILSKGGIFGGDGGFVEVSGHKLILNGYINTLAPKGKAGNLLLDPNTITLEFVDANNANCSGSPNTTCTNFPGDDDVIGIGFIQDYLNNGNVIIQTTSATPGPGDGDITLINDITTTNWATTNSLTLIAAHDLILNSSISGNGALTLSAGNAIQLNSSGSIATAGGQSYSASSIQFNTPMTISSGGNINFSGSTLFTSPSTVTSSGSQTYSGPVLFNSTTAISSGGTQTYNSSVTAAAPTTLSLTGANANMKFSGTISGGTNLTIQGSSGLTNQIDMSTYGGGQANIFLNDVTNINNGIIRSGTELAPGTTLAQFKSMGGLIGNSSNTDISLTILKSNPTFTITSGSASGPATGFVNDPFSFTNVFVPALASLVTPSSLIPDSVKWTPQYLDETTATSGTETAASNLVTESLDDTITQQDALDKKQAQSLSACY